jgi:beta-lactamase regulating signal transducer with metallopeptidase domain
VWAIDRLAQTWSDWIVPASWQLALLTCLVAAVLVVTARQISPRLRHALWLLVLLKVFLPPGLTAPWSVGRWAIAPLVNQTGISQTLSLSRRTAEPKEAAVSTGQAAPPIDETVPVQASPLSRDGAMSPAVWMMLGWLAGVLAFWAAVAWRYARLLRASRAAPTIDEGPVRVTLEQMALSMGLRRMPELLSTTDMTSPFLFGIFRPRIVLPERSLAALGATELRAILTHELVHWQRHDTWIGWIQVLAQSLFWFHPFVWWANHQLRHERECACDEAVLRLGQITSEDYSDSIVLVLRAVRARSSVAGSLVGVFERGAKLHDRLEGIMNYESSKRRFGWMSRAAVVLLAVLLLPLAPGDAGLAADEAPVAKPAPVKTPYPQLVSTVPKIGATDVDPDLQEITVTFDRDMSDGMSWTGGPPLFPPTDKSREARWRDPRTCVLPVMLEKGAYYRLGLNSKSYHNFRSANNTPMPPSAIYFVTKGASAEVARRVRRPEVVSFAPANGAKDVDPKRVELSVTFDMPMEGGMSWTGGGADFPEGPQGVPPSWSADGLTCTKQVTLEPAHDYQVGINSLSHNNFQSKWGAPLMPIVYKFRTRDK